MDVIAAAIRVGVGAGVHTTEDPQFMTVQGGRVVGPCRGFAIHLPAEQTACQQDPWWQRSVITLDIFQTGISIRWQKWFTETSQSL